MTTIEAAGGADVSRRLLIGALIAGVVVGIAYTLSPFSVIAAVAFVLLIRWAGAAADAQERRWLYAIVIAAVLLRALAIAGLFVVTDHHQVPFGSFFGDEEYFMRRSLWMRNIALRVPISAADFIYAYEDLGKTSYLYVLAAVHVLFGPAIYGAHLLSALLYVAASLVLYRLVRPVYGRLASLLSLALLLFLPSLFVWSISTLKEPLFFFVMSFIVAAAVMCVRGPNWAQRLAALLVVFGLSAFAQTVRDAGLALSAGGAAAGIALTVVAKRPRIALYALLAALIVVPIALGRGKVDDAIVGGIRSAAVTNWGHVNTAGYVYKTLSPHLYEDRGNIAQMTVRECAQYVVRSFVSYIVVPAPWQVQSRAALSFLPEQMLWYVLALLVPFGVVAGLRRDPVLTCVLLAFGSIAAVLVALSTGNIGTLVRHRGLALPYLLWFSALGATELAARTAKDTYAAHR